MGFNPEIKKPTKPVETAPRKQADPSKIGGAALKGAGVKKP
ncbi:MAG: hypothetical protein AAGC46_00365 [Solirubrobacteraceae bacterium]|nr:hypothetical protein [Patulibacter sp.]